MSNGTGLAVAPAITPQSQADAMAQIRAIAQLNNIPLGGQGDEYANPNVYYGSMGNGGTVWSWDPALGVFPADLPRLLAWQYKSFAVFNHFGKIACVPIDSNVVSVPFVVPPPYEVGTTSLNACGVYFPRDFCWEAVFRGIYRIKISFAVYNVHGAMTPLEIKVGLEDSMNLRIGQCGTINSYIVFLNMDASDAVRNSHCCNGDGFFLAPCEEFIPFALAPESQSVEIQGTAPGSAGDSYDFLVHFRLYFKPIC